MTKGVAGKDLSREPQGDSGDSSLTLLAAGRRLEGVGQEWYTPDSFAIRSCVANTYRFRCCGMGHLHTNLAGHRPIWSIPWFGLTLTYRLSLACQDLRRRAPRQSTTKPSGVFAGKTSKVRNAFGISGATTRMSRHWAGAVSSGSTQLQAVGMGATGDDGAVPRTRSRWL